MTEIDLEAAINYVRPVAESATVGMYGAMLKTVLDAAARLREAEQAMTELTKDEEVTVEGSIFRWSELPEVLARNMRAVTEARQEAKRWAIRSEESTARLREAEDVIEKIDVEIDQPVPDGEVLVAIELHLSRYKTTKTEATDCEDGDAPDRWVESGGMGGYVCSMCGVPVESEPCDIHQPDAYARCVGTDREVGILGA